MNFISFVILYILGPEILLARTYLVINLDALKQQKLSPQGVPRQTGNKISMRKPKDFLKTAVNILQTNDDDQLDVVFNSFKNGLADLNIDDTNSNKAKEFVLNELSQLSKPGKQMKRLMGAVPQMINKNNNHGVTPSLRTRHDAQIVRRLLDIHGEKTNRAWMFQDNIFDTMKPALRMVANFSLPEDLTRAEELTPEHKDVISQLQKIFQEQRNDKQTTETSDWKKNLFNKIKNKFENPNENETKTDWKNILSKFLNEEKENDSIIMFKDLVKKLGNEDNVWNQRWEQQQNFAKQKMMDKAKKKF